MINWYTFFICKKVNRKGSCQLNYLFTSNGGKGDHSSTAVIGSTRFAVMREVFHLCGRVWFQLVSLAAVFWMTHHAPPKELPQKFLLGSVPWHPKIKTAARETKFHRWVKNRVVSRPCQEVFLPVFPIQFCPPPKNNPEKKMFRGIWYSMICILFIIRELRSQHCFPPGGTVMWREKTLTEP